jgi:hypothetical protein
MVDILAVILWNFNIQSKQLFYKYLRSNQTVLSGKYCTVCQYLTLYRLLVLCHYVHCCLLQSVHYLSVPHTVLYLESMSTAVSTVFQYLTLYPSLSVCPPLSFTFCPLSVSTSVLCSVSLCPLLSSTVSPLSVPHTVLNLESMSTAVSTVCQYLTLYTSLSVCPPLSSTFCPLSVSTSLLCSA